MDLLSKNITIESVEGVTTSTGKQRFKIKGDGLTFGLWKLKADGTETKAYQYLKTLGFDANGKQVNVAYKEEAGEYNGKAITYRTIVGMGDVRNEQAKPSNGLEQRIKALENDIAWIKAKLKVGSYETPVQEDVSDIEQSWSPTSNTKDEIDVEDIPF